MGWNDLLEGWAEGLNPVSSPREQLGIHIMPSAGGIDQLCSFLSAKGEFGLQNIHLFTAGDPELGSNVQPCASMTHSSQQTEAAQGLDYIAALLEEP